jgi:hypothetical protein
MWLEADFDTLFAKVPRQGDGGWALHEADPVRVGWLLQEAPPGSGVYGATRIASLPDPTTGELKAASYPVMHIFSADHAVNYGREVDKLLGKVPDGIIRAVREANEDPIQKSLLWGADVLAWQRRDGRESLPGHARRSDQEPFVPGERGGARTQDDRGAREPDDAYRNLGVRACGNACCSAASSISSANSPSFAPRSH